MSRSLAASILPAILQISAVHRRFAASSEICQSRIISLFLIRERETRKALGIGDFYLLCVIKGHFEEDEVWLDIESFKEKYIGIVTASGRSITQKDQTLDTSHLS